MRRLLPLLTASLVAAGGVAVPAAPAASSLIVVNKSVDGIRLLAPPGAVRDRLGKPTRISRRAVPGGSQTGSTSYETWAYAKRKLQVTLFRTAPSRSFKVASFDISGRTERTASGLRVGSSLADVQAKLAGAACNPGFAGSTQCLVRGGRVGPTKGREFVTQFSVENGRVRFIMVSYNQTWNLPPPG